MANQISARFLKVVEGDIDGADENGVVDVAVKDAQIIAYAKWNVPVLVDGKLSGGGDDADDMPVWPEGADAELCNDVFPYFARERKKNMGERPHYCTFLPVSFPFHPRERLSGCPCQNPHSILMWVTDLEIVATLPEHQGKGAAGKLIRWGLERADREGLEAYLEASPAAVPIYEHYGFKTVSSYSPKRIEHTESFMLRAPRPTEE